MYALVEINGKQYRAEKGSLLRVDLMSEEPGSEVELDKLIMISQEGSTRFGTPYLDKARITATVGKTVKGTKIKVIKFKRRKGYHRTQGHRQSYTMLKVNDISS